MSRMLATSSPAAWIALMAVSLPLPGPLTYTSTFLIPHASMALFATASATSWAAKGVDFLVPLNPALPALELATTSPFWSVIVTMVLLKVA